MIKIIMRWLTLCLLMSFAVNTMAQESNARVNAMSSVLNLRATPHANAPILAELAGNTPLIILARTSDNRWYQAQTLSGEVGWVASAYITLQIQRDSVPIQHLNNNATPPTSDNNTGATNTTPSTETTVAVGRSTNFAKVGDSITHSEMFLHAIGLGKYDINNHAHLQSVIDYFLQGDNSFLRTSLASGNGWTTETVLDPDFANSQRCHQGESPLACEYRLTSPAVALIMLGTNDVALVPQDVYAHNLATITRISLEHGVLPILSTIPYRVGYETQVHAFNRIIHNVAADYNVPVWDYFSAMAGLPNAGLSDDGIHPSIPNGGLDRVADFTGEALWSGYTMRNLTALHVLHSIMERIR